MKNSERRCKLSEYFWVFLKNVSIRIKIMRKIFTRAVLINIKYSSFRYNSWQYWNIRQLFVFKMSLKIISTLRFDEKDSVSGVQQLKSSVQKGIRAKLLELYPHLESHIDVIIPKKDAFRIVKWWVMMAYVRNLFVI